MSSLWSRATAWAWPTGQSDIASHVTHIVLSRENSFNFPTSLYRKKFESKYFPAKKEEEKKGIFQDDLGSFRRETSKDLMKSEEKVYDKTKLAESLPFGDIIEKYNKLKEDLRKARY